MPFLSIATYTVYKEVSNMKRKIYFAGGCFWGMELLFSKVDAVTDVTCGYANGLDEQYANYNDVCSGKSQFRESIEVVYDEDSITLENLLFIFFVAINPTEFHRQGPDIGSQYQTGVYYSDPSAYSIISKIFDVEKKHYPNFFVELKPLKNFFPAEEYHQKYLIKNPNGYCHIGKSLIYNLHKFKIIPEQYTESAKIIFSNYIENNTR